MHAGYQSYIDAQDRVSALWRDPQTGTRSSILNTAGMGKSSSDRSIVITVNVSGTFNSDLPAPRTVPVPHFKTFCAILDRAGARPPAYLAVAETALAERVKQAATDLRASGKTTFAP